MTDAELRYLDIVKQIVKASQGVIPADERSLLERARYSLGLSSTDAAAIEQRVLEAYQAFLARSPHHSTRSATAPVVDSVRKNQIQHIDQTQRVAAIRQIESQDVEAARQEKRRWYAEEFAKVIDGDRVMNDATTHDRLLSLQRELELERSEVAQIEQQVYAAKLNLDLDQFNPAILTQPFSSPQPVDALPPTRLQSARSHSSTSTILPSYYRELVNCLQTRQWRQADQETFLIMLHVTHREEQGWLNSKAIETFPCEDLQRLDRLWGEHSNEKFSFRRQRRIYHNTPLPKPSLLRLSNATYDKALIFSKTVGWWRSGAEFYKYYNQLTFDLEDYDIPDGHLPALWFWKIPWWRAMRFGGLWASRGGCSVDVQTLSTFMGKLQNCQIM